MEAYLNHQYPLATRQLTTALDLDYELTRDFSTEKFRQFSSIDEFPNLRKLSVSNHELEDLMGLRGVPHLEALDVSYNQLSSWDGLPHLPNLRELDVSFNECTGLDFQGLVPKLETLRIGHNFLANLSGINRLEALRLLAISGNRRVKQIDSLFELPLLETLYAKGMFIKDWRGVRLASQLKSLYITPTSQLSLDPLQHCQHLTVLHMSMGRLSGTVRIPALPKLETFIATKGPQVAQVTGWEDVRSLQRVDLSFNQLVEVPRALTLLPNLTFVSFRGNPLQSAHHLENLGHQVKVDLRETALPGPVLKQLISLPSGPQILW
ncbi:leucine-rich repeat domain-containing protein [Pontibacter sp. G13]|uniref:leucine-rich repeat domain-containing protein n=1 Tax=Pontibacter sp. G13 TaxID=3074898 RepID=UPI00288A6396|nr:leucine-rich repeat domain-containing protein [Pontibacter sp. G13]WNJ21051.1 leucine-rich repeat domain-containing protein [Pontibacter sp. G13]